jgi:hypothetical protein
MWFVSWSNIFLPVVTPVTLREKIQQQYGYAHLCQYITDDPSLGVFGNVRE